MWLAVILAAVYLSLNIGIAVFGKRIVISQIENNLKRKAGLDSLNVGFPLSVNIHGLDIRDLARIDYLSLRPSILGFLAGKIVLNEVKIIRPQITLEMDAQGRLNVLPPASASRPQILLAGLDIREGRVIFIDKKIDPAGYMIVINNINMNISKASFPPTSLFTRFNISALLGEDGNKPRGRLSASGWIDFRPRDMDGEVAFKDVDLTYLTPYYQGSLGGKKIASAKLNFGSDLEAKNNELKAKCRLEISDLVYEKETQEQGQQESMDLVPMILNVFSDSSRKAAFDFTLNTRLDNPRLNLKEIQGVIGEAAMQNIASQPPEKIIGNIKDVEKQFKEIGRTFKELFKKRQE